MQKLTNVSEKVRTCMLDKLLLEGNKPPSGPAQRLAGAAPAEPHCSSRMRNMRRSGSAAPQSNWSPMVKAPR